MSAYKKHYNKQPYTYTFRRCDHNHTHIERVDGGVFECCDACGTIRENLSFNKNVHELKEAA